MYFSFCLEQGPVYEINSPIGKKLSVSIRSYVNKEAYITQYGTESFNEIMKISKITYEDIIK